jgi:hypothetical protein
VLAKIIIILSDFFCKVKYKTNEECFTIAGRSFFGTGFFIICILPIFFSLLYFDEKIAKWMFLSVFILAVMVILFPVYWFKIKVDKDIVVIKLLFLFVPFKTIKSATKNLIIDHKDTEHLTLISKNKNSYTKERENRILEFSFIEPMDGNREVFYVDYKGKEIDLGIVCRDEEVWNNLINGFKLLEQ